MEGLLEKATAAAMYIREFLKETPEIAIILGSGLSKLTNEIRDKVEIPYVDIPNFPVSKVYGHNNKLIYGTIYGKPVLTMSGRFHTYEGYTMQEVAFPIKVFALLGISKLIVSNAAGAINKKFKRGDLMLITDHIKMSGDSPLSGENIDEFGERFPDMSESYSVRMQNIARGIAKMQKINLQEGVYAFMPGPQYETPAELKMLSILGADAVGMSTVPEVISAAHSDMEVMGISCITNTTNGNEKISHSDVIETANQVESKFVRFVMGIIDKV